MVAAATADLALVVLLAFGVAMRERLREAWYVWRLESGDPAEQDRAAEALAAMGSPQGTQHLYGKLQRDLQGYRLTVSFNNRPLGDFVNFFHASTGIEVRLDPSLDPASIRIANFSGREMRAVDVLNNIAMLAGLRYRIEGRVIILCPQTFTNLPPEEGSP